MYEHVQEIVKVDDEILKSAPAIYRWKVDYPRVTLHKFRLFTPTGDFNDAVFDLPKDVCDDPKKHLRPWLKNYSSFVVGATDTNNMRKMKNRIKLTKLDELAVNKKIEKDDATIIYFMKIIERNWAFNTGLAKGTTAWSTINGFIGPALKSEAEMKKRNLLDNDLSLRKKTREHLSAHFEADPSTFCIFAERMLQNIKNFEKFVSSYDPKGRKSQK